MTKLRILASLLASSAIATFASPAFGQAAAAPVDAEASDGEIIVTAQRRDESLSRTPVAVAVLDSEVLAEANIVSEQDLRVATPGLSIRAASNSNQLNYALRGHTTDPFANTRPGVLPYVNEIQIGGTGGSSAFYDLQSIQVLKGPQGTLFGRSATGGAVLFTTAKPTDELTGYVSGLVGDYGALKFEGAIGGPIVGDKLMARVAGFYQERNGFQRNILFGGREGDLKRSGLRGSLTADLGSIRNELVVDYFHSDSESTVGVINGLNTNGGFPTSVLYAGIAEPGRSIAIATLQAFTGAPLANVTGFYDFYFSQPTHPAGGVGGVLAAQRARGPYRVQTDAANEYRANNYIVSNRTIFEIGDGVEIRNIFGYTHLKTFINLDTDGTPYIIAENDAKGSDLGLGIFNTTEQVSNELQLVGDALADRLSYVAGFYFSDEKYLQDQNPQFFDIFFGFPPQAHFRYNAKNTTYAGYAQGTYKLNDSGLAVTLGARYTSEKVRKITLPTDTNRVALGEPAPAGYDYDKSRTFNRVSWSIGLQDQVNSNLLLYAVSRRAYKSGGFNGSVAPKNGGADVAGDEYSAERVTDAELGAKYQGTMGATPIRLNLALYHNWVRNSQRVANTLVAGSPQSVTVNVPRGKTYGLELDGQFSPAQWLTLGGSFNYTHARFSSAPAAVNGQTQVFDQVPDTPETSGTIFGDIEVPVSGGVSALLHGDVYHQSRNFTAPRSSNNAGSVIPKYTLVNLRAGLGDKDVGWSLTANLKNVFDKTYFVGGLPTGEIFQINTLIPGEPRTFTVEARFKF